MTRPLDPENFVADKFAWHQQIAMDPKLSMSAKAVAGLILHDLNEHRGGAWRGQESMAACLGVGERQLRRLLNELEKADYLQIEGSKGRGRTNVYRAIRPVKPENAASVPAENRSQESAQPPEKRTLTSGQCSEKRTSASRKPDMDDRQYLYDPNRYKRAPAKALERRVHPIRIPRPFEEDDIRNLVVGLAGEEATISYLDPARWDRQNRRIICGSRTGHDRLSERVGKSLSARGVAIVLDDRRPLMAA
jgi:hypothetical protein